MRLTDKQYDELLRLAKSTRGASYSPYSHFSVGAALLCADGSVYTGTNVENSSFSATICAERVAFFDAVRDGKREFSAVAVVGGAHGEDNPEECLPCAVCMQVMAEFCDGDFEIVTEDKNGTRRVRGFSELLPKRFKF